MKTKTTWHRLLSMLLICMMLASLLPTAAFAAEPKVTNVTLNGNVLTWDPYPGAGVYKIKYTYWDNSGPSGTMTVENGANLQKKFDEWGRQSESYKIIVQALDNFGGTVLAESDPIKYDYSSTNPTLPAPQVTIDKEKLTATITPVEHAEKYEVWQPA